MECFLVFWDKIEVVIFEIDIFVIILIYRFIGIYRFMGIYIYNDRGGGRGRERDLYNLLRGIIK